MSSLDDIMYSGGVEVGAGLNKKEEESASLDEAMYGGGVETAPKKTTISQDIGSGIEGGLEVIVNVTDAAVEVPLAMATAMMGMSVAGVEAIYDGVSGLINTPDETMPLTDQIGKRIAEYTYNPDGEYSKTIMNGVHSLGGWIHEKVKIGSDAGYDLAQFLGAPKEVSAGVGAGIQAAGDWFALPYVIKGGVLTAQVVGKAKALAHPVKAYKEYATEVRKKQAENLMNDVYDRMSKIDGIVASLDDATHIESTIPGFKFDFADATQSPTVRAMRQEVVGKSPTAEISYANLQKSNKQATVKYIEEIYGSNAIDAPRKIIEKVVETAKGSIDGVISGLAKQIESGQIKLMNMRLGFKKPRTEDLATSMQSVFEFNIGINKALGNALYSRIGEAPTPFGSVLQAAIEVKKDSRLWAEGKDFPEIINKVIERGEALSGSNARLAQEKMGQMERLQERARRDPNFDIAQLEALANEIQQLQQPQALNMTFKEMRDFDKAVNSLYGMESKGINNRPNAHERTAAVGKLKGAIAESMESLSKSGNETLVRNYSEAKAFWQENIVGKFYTGALKDLMEAGDFYRTKALTYESMVDSAFKSSTAKKGGVRGIRNYLEAIDGNTLGMVVLKETIFRKFAEETKATVKKKDINETKISVVDSAKATQFIEKYSAMLDEVPAIKEMLKNSKGVIEAIEWANANRRMRQEVINQSHISELIGSKNPYKTFFSIIESGKEAKILKVESKLAGISEETMMHMAIQGILQSSRKRTGSKEFSVDLKAANDIIQKSEGFKYFSNAEHRANLDVILRASEGEMFPVKILHEEKMGTSIISKAEDILGRSYGSYITDLRAYYQGRTSARQVVTSGLASMFTKMSKGHEIRLKEAALFDTKLATHIAEIKKRINKGEKPTEKQWEGMSLRIHALGLSKVIMGKVIATTKEGLVIQKAKGKYTLRKDTPKIAVGSGIYSEQ